MTDMNTKALLRRQLRQALENMSEADRHEKSVSACRLAASCDEFRNAHVVMLYLSMPTEVDTAALALKCWQAGKTVVVPKVSWDQRRMLPVEISSLKDAMTTTGPVREPLAGNPIPLDMIDLVFVPGLGFSPEGFRIGRGMGFYDRFLAQPEFVGRSCGLAFEDQVVPTLPVLDHDVVLNMLVTDRGIRRFATKAVASGQ